MKKVLMGHEEQSTMNTNISQSNELITTDTDNSINIQNETIVRILFFFCQKFLYLKTLNLG